MVRLRETDSFQTLLEKYPPEKVRDLLQSVQPADIVRALRERTFSARNFLALLSPHAEMQLSGILPVSEKITRQRFGKIIQLYAPLYLSNECQNICTYCGFSFTNKIPRKTLTEEEILKEARYLKSKGFEHILLVTGESAQHVGMPYFHKALDILVPMFAQISMEVQPLETEEYQELHERGVYSILVYQETYLKDTYRKFHPKGKKSNFNYRLETPDRIGKAGMHHIGLGVLLGLDDWRIDSFYCALHLDYLHKKYWKSRFSVSFPRIRPAEGVEIHPVHFSNKNLAQLIAAYRICFPDLEISLSTRESPEFRNRILPYGITQMSAESKTNPGGYTLEKNLEQFSTDDKRTLEEICEVIRKQGLDPVLKNWYSMMV